MTLPKNYKPWRPLPEGLKILESKIEGQGLFAVKMFPKFMDLGITHYVVNGEVIRPALGAWINHSSTIPNCNIVDNESGTHSLITLKTIYPDDELLVDYSLSSCLEICSK